MQNKIYKEAIIFKESFNKISHNKLLGINDGKSVGTYIEDLFKKIIKNKYGIIGSSSSKGIDLPDEQIDIKSTLLSRPQSSCPFKSFKEYIYGLDYSLLIFMYEKEDDFDNKQCNIKIKEVFFIDKKETSDYKITKQINNILNKTDSDINKKNQLKTILKESNIFISVSNLEDLIEYILKNPPIQGKITFSGAMQWRLTYYKLKK